MNKCSASYEVGGGYSQEELNARDRTRKKQLAKEEPSVDSSAHYQAILKGGDQVTSVLEEIAKLVPLYFSLYPYLLLRIS